MRYHHIAGNLRKARPGKAGLVGFALGVCALVALTVSMVAGDDQVRPPGSPSGALLPGTPSIPDEAQPLDASTASSSIVGRVRILPSGSVPEDNQWAYLPVQGTITMGLEAGTDAAAQQALERWNVSLQPVPVPDGFALNLGGAEAVELTDGQWLIWNEYYRFTSTTQFPLEVAVRLMNPGELRDLVAPEPVTGHALAVLDVEGIAVVVLGGTPKSTVQPLSEAWFVLHDHLVYIDAPALPPAVLVDFIKAWITSQGDRYLESSKVLNLHEGDTNGE